METRMKDDDDEKDVEIPQDGDENVGDEVPKKKIKKRKSKEERIADRKTVFWTLLIVLLITLGFWMAPRLTGLFSGNNKEINTKEEGNKIIPEKETGHKNYVEITL